MLHLQRFYIGRLKIEPVSRLTKPVGVTEKFGGVLSLLSLCFYSISVSIEIFVIEVRTEFNLFSFSNRNH